MEESVKKPRRHWKLHQPRRSRAKVFDRPKRLTGPKKGQRTSNVSQIEGILIGRLVAEQKDEITDKQVTALATLLTRRESTIRILIKQNRQRLAGNAALCVDTHKDAMVNALEDGDNETAGRLAIWGMEHISLGGERIVDKATDTANSGVQVFVGLKFGGMRETDPPKVIE